MNCVIGGLNRKYMVVAQIFSPGTNGSAISPFPNSTFYTVEDQQIVELNSCNRLRSSYYLLSIVLYGFHVS